MCQYILVKGTGKDKFTITLQKAHCEQVRTFQNDRRSVHFFFFGSNILSRLKIVTWMGIVVFFKNQIPLIVKMHHHSVYHNEKNMLMIDLCMLLTISCILISKISKSLKYYIFIAFSFLKIVFACIDFWNISCMTAQ